MEVSRIGVEEGRITVVGDGKGVDVAGPGVAVMTTTTVAGGAAVGAGGAAHPVKKTAMRIKLTTSEIGRFIIHLSFLLEGAPEQALAILYNMLGSAQPLKFTA